MQFETLREQMLRAGVAPRRVRRYTAELNNHLTDLIEQERASGYNQTDAAQRARALLGSDAELVEAWLREPALKSLASRAPWLVFGLLPPFAAILTLLPPTLLLVVIAKSNGLMEAHRIPPDWFRLLAGIVVQSGNLILLPCVALLFVMAAQRQRLSPLWSALAAGLLVFLGVRMQYYAGTPNHLGSLGVGMGPFFFPKARRMFAEQWAWVAAQWFLTLLPALGFVIVHRLRQKV